LGEEVHSPEIAGILGTTEKEIRLLARMVERKVNSPLTSSCGRLFDAAAVVITGRRIVDYEAQAAIELEGLATRGEEAEPENGYPIHYVEGNWESRRPFSLDVGEMWSAILADKRKGTAPAKMSMRFHVGVAEAYAQLALSARRLTGINKVCLSGGVFHNALLHRLLHRLLVDENFEVYAQSIVSPGDGGISYGQAVVAAARLKGPQQGM
jgi:hydrogenase maturation protein HypF